MVVQKHVEIDGVKHRLAFLSPGRFTTAAGSPSQAIDTSQRPYSTITLLNTDGSNTCYVGAGAQVSSANGIPLGPGSSMRIASNDPSERVRLSDVFIAGDGTNQIVVAFWGV